MEIESQKQKMLDKISNKLGIKTKEYFDLHVEKKVASEYMTHEEFKKRKKEKKQQKIKTRQTSDFSFLR